jgi:hypothetical protein
MKQPNSGGRRSFLAGVAVGIPTLLGIGAWTALAQPRKKLAEKLEKAEKGTERHPHIRAAIRELRDAKQELEHASHDFGGHRVKAMEASDVAIKQLELALQFDKR